MGAASTPPLQRGPFRNAFRPWECIPHSPFRMPWTVRGGTRQESRVSNSPWKPFYILIKGLALALNLLC